MGRHLKHCKRGSGKGAKQQKDNKCTHALPVQGNNQIEPAPKKRKNKPRSAESKLRRRGKRISKHITRLEEETADLLTTLANTATDAVASSSTGVEQQGAAGGAASYPVDLESSTSGDLPDYREEGAESSAGGSPATEYQ